MSSVSNTVSCSLTGQPLPVTTSPLSQRLKAMAPKPWMATVLLLAAAYNALFGSFTVFFPNALFEWVGAEVPNYPQLWQCVGMVVGVYGVGYAIAALNPYRYWPIVVVGLLGKILGPLGFVWALLQGTFPPAFGWVILTNDLIWWVPFYLILHHKAHHFITEAKVESEQQQAQRSQLLQQAVTVSGQTILALSQTQPLLLVFLRHTGCTFCREMVSELAQAQPVLEEKGLTPVLVHMETPEGGQAFLTEYGLPNLQHVSDPTATLYRTLGLNRGNWSQLFGWKTIARGFEARRFGVGALSGDGFQLSGYAVLSQGEVCVVHPHSFAGEKTPFEALANHYGENTKALYS